LTEKYDLIVIGAGPAGEKGASKAAHIIGEQASELIHFASDVMLVGGPIDEFIEAVYNHSTLSDTDQYTAYDGLANHAMWREANK
jgi:pyruvate/2-oxoglutarate dehydrogenase complex dihydrolipoamide dehydrogenase (E3) component